jgi:hypothetical protein
MRFSVCGSFWSYTLFPYEGVFRMDIELYKKMYAILCSAADRAITLLSSPETTPKAKPLLEQALLSAEELYLCATDEESAS